MAAKRMVKICTAEKPWLISTLVLTKLVPQKVMVAMARMCQMAMEPEEFFKPIFTNSNIKIKKIIFGVTLLPPCGVL